MKDNTIKTFEQAKLQGFDEVCGTWARKTKLNVTITWDPTKHKGAWGVYVFHGHPGGAFWRNNPPIVRKDTLNEAREVAETLYGVSGSGVLANVVTIS